MVVIVTLGAEGARLQFAGTTVVVRSPRVAVVDTTGAGDALVGALAAALDAGAELAEELRFGVAAGALACTALGAQPALPRRDAIDAALRLVTHTGPR